MTKVLDNKTLRGKLIELILDTYVTKKVFTDFIDEAVNMQEELNRHLYFTTVITNADDVVNGINYDIKFKDENDIDKVINFSLTVNTVNLKIVEN